jgi:hypothetical protein
MPLWKASYRLVASEADGLLQGWAILENLSGQDWQGVEVTLAAGSPRALRQALFQSYFVDRPEVPVLPEAPVALPAPAPRVAMAAPSFAQAEKSMMMADTAGDAPAGLAVGAAQELTAQTLFRLPQPVSLPVGHTVMAPVVDQPVPVERIALYRAPESGQHPRAALRIRNATGASLPGGVVTLYERLPEGGLTYLGDATLPQTPPEAEALLAYGLDGNIDVAVREDTTARLDRARIADGVLQLARVEQRRSVYALDARFSGQPRSFVLEQPLPQGWRLAEPADAVLEGEQVRVTRPLPPQSKAEVAVVLERPVVEQIALLEADPERLLLTFRGMDPPPEVRAAVERLRELSARLGDLDQQIEAAEARRAEEIREQERLRANLEAVPRDSDLARRYLEGLAASEDALAGLARRLEELRAARLQAAADRVAFVRSLRV